MANWKEFFTDDQYIKRAPDPEVYQFIVSLEKLFPEHPLRIWDVGCGAGRHTVAMASSGHETYASDSNPNAIKLTREWLAEIQLPAQVELADMTICPWSEKSFHGVISWDVLYHNTLNNIRRAVDEIHSRLIPGGLFLGTFKSTKADLYGEGKALESGTYVNNQIWGESDIPHLYFDESGIRNLFKNWEIISLAEQVITYIERGPNFREFNPFPYTTWGVLASKKE